MNESVIGTIARLAGVYVYHAHDIDLYSVAEWSGFKLTQRCPDYPGCWIFISRRDQEAVSEYMRKITGRD